MRTWRKDTTLTQTNNDFYGPQKRCGGGGAPVDISHSKANNESEHCPGPKLLYRSVSRLDRLCERLFFLEKPPLSWKLRWQNKY